MYGDNTHYTYTYMYMHTPFSVTLCLHQLHNHFSVITIVCICTCTRTCIYAHVHAYMHIHVHERLGHGVSARSAGGHFSCGVVGISAKIQVCFVLGFLRICCSCKLRISDHWTWITKNQKWQHCIHMHKTSIVGEWKWNTEVSCSLWLVHTVY